MAAVWPLGRREGGCGWKGLPTVPDFRQVQLRSWHSQVTIVKSLWVNHCSSRLLPRLAVVGVALYCIRISISLLSWNIPCSVSVAQVMAGCCISFTASFVWFGNIVLEYWTLMLRPWHLVHLGWSRCCNIHSHGEGRGAFFYLQLLVHVQIILECLGCAPYNDMYTRVHYIACTCIYVRYPATKHFMKTVLSVAGNFKILGGVTPASMCMYAGAKSQTWKGSATCTMSRIFCILSLRCTYSVLDCGSRWGLKFSSS